MTKTGRCLCGAVTYSYEGLENWQAHCHCESCRRATASPMTYENERCPEEIHLYAATLDRPADFEPEFQVHADEQLPWLRLADGPPNKVF